MSAYQYSEMEMDLRASCEAGYEIGEAYRPEIPARAPTGERYRELTNVRAPAESAEGAFKLAQLAFADYARDRTGRLYWRVYPEIAAMGQKGWGFYMRLLISDKPVIASARSA